MEKRNHGQEVIAIAKREGIQLTQEALLMIHGVKPAFLLSSKPGRPTAKMIEYLKAMYPSIGFPHRANSSLIFREGTDMLKFTQEGLVAYDSKLRDVSVLDYKQEQLGIYLGYPPKAAKWFVDNADKVEGKIPARSGVSYHGISFVCSPDDTKECVEWMLENRPVPEALQTEISITSVDSITGKRTKSKFEYEPA